MKRALLFMLLISVGLNIGLAVSYHRSRDEAQKADPWYGPAHGPGRHDPADPRPVRPDRVDGEGRGRLREMHSRLEPELAEHRVAVQEARVVFSGVAPVPWRSASVERVITGESLTDDVVRLAGEVAVESAQPMRDNEYKVRLLRGILEDELAALA